MSTCFRFRLCILRDNFERQLRMRVCLSPVRLQHACTHRRARRPRSGDPAADEGRELQPQEPSDLGLDAACPISTG